MDLDELLKRSAPCVATRTPELSDALRLLVAHSEEQAMPRRRGLRLGTAAVVTAGVIGLGSAATATGLLPLPEWRPWSTSSGSTCEITIEATVADERLGRDLGTFAEVQAMSEADKQSVLTAAEVFLADFDYATINVEDAIRTWQRTESEVRAAVSADERPPKLVGDDLEIHAVHVEVLRQLHEFLMAQGLNPEALNIWRGSRCDR